MKDIRFIKGGSNTILGNFEPGDRARCSDALASHLIDELGVAVHAIPKRGVTAAEAQAAAVAAPGEAKRGRRGGR